MKLGIPREDHAREKRVSVVPETVKRLSAKKIEACVEAGAGARSHVRDEDYRLVAGLQANLASGARDHLLFGRNEPGLQHRHLSWASRLSATASAVDR